MPIQQCTQSCTESVLLMKTRRHRLSSKTKEKNRAREPLFQTQSLVDRGAPRGRVGYLAAPGGDSKVFGSATLGVSVRSGASQTRQSIGQLAERPARSPLVVRPSRSGLTGDASGGANRSSALLELMPFRTRSLLSVARPYQGRLPGPPRSAAGSNDSKLCLSSSHQPRLPTSDLRR